MCAQLDTWLLISILVFLVGALLESNARTKHAINHYSRRFWHTWPACKAGFWWLVGLGRWKAVCPDCDGTGLCNHPNPRHPHSCCGACNRVWVARTAVPLDFDGVECGAGERWPGFCAEAGVPVGTALALIGSGWVEGSFWWMLRRGRWRGRWT